MAWLDLMAKRARFIAAALAVSGCTSPFQPLKPMDAGAGSTYSGCPNGAVACGSICCPSGASCVSGSCQYPYSSAHLYVYLCPSFNTGNCQAKFFALDQTCSSIQAAQPGTCYDTGLEVAAQHNYGLASCTACGSGCSNPVSLRTPSGFVTPNYYPGSTWSCNAPCTAPTDCGGGLDPQNGLARCTTGDCWLAALKLQEGGSDLPLLAIAQPSPPMAASGGGAPRITSLNGAAVSSSQTLALSAASQPGAQVEFDYDFDDPTGCSPGVCFSMPSCPANVRCETGTKTLCTRAKHDGALTGSIIRTLGVRAEPADGSTTTTLPLQVQLIAGPADPKTGSCSDPIDESDPSHPTFASGVLAGAPLQLTVPIAGADGTTATSDAGTADAGRDAGASDAGATSAAANVCCCDFRSDDMWHCTHSMRDNALCAVPWPDCCSMQYTVCE